MTPYQRDVQEFHQRMGLPTGNYETPAPLSGDMLKMRANLLDEELLETARALAIGDVVEVVDGLIDVAVITLGTFDVAGLVARPRFAEIIATGAYHRPWLGLTEHVATAIRGVLSEGRSVTAVMWREHNRGWAFQRFDLLDDLLKQVAHAFTMMGPVDPRPHWNEVVRSNQSKYPPTYREDGKLLKGPHYSPPDIAGILRAQGVVK